MPATCRLCGSSLAEHAHVVRVRTRVDTDEIETRVRGHLYQELDVLAFALELEASEALEAGREEEAVRAQRTRLGVRLAQRLVGGVPAPEVDERLDRRREQYMSKFPS